jgi:hypothetical protein
MVAMVAMLGAKAPGDLWLLLCIPTIPSRNYQAASTKHKQGALNPMFGNPSATTKEVLLYETTNEGSIGSLLVSLLPA